MSDSQFIREGRILRDVRIPASDVANDLSIINERLRAALSDTNALLGCILTVWPSKDMLPKIEKQYEENLITLR